MKITFKILGVLVILLVGISFLFYGDLNRILTKAEKAYKHGDFEQAELLYKKGMDGLKKWLFSVKKLELARVWAFYYQGYYKSEKYDLAEEITNRELKNEKSFYKDQLYNLQALICWQKGVELFIGLGKKAASLKELDQLIEEAKTNSQEAVNFNNGKDWDIKYNWEFFRKDKRELKKNMQQQAQQKQKDREMKGKTEQITKEKKIKSNQEDQTKGRQKQKEQKAKKEKKNEGEKVKVLTPEEKKEKPEEETSQTNQKKKKKG